MEVYYLTDVGVKYRWSVLCPSLPVAEQKERDSWCQEQGIDFAHLGVNFWFVEEHDVVMFKLRWA